MLAPFGFRRTSLLPAYGIAEATLAVTGVSPGEEWTALEVEPASLSLGCKIVPAARQGTTVIGCGCPLQFVSVAILDEEGRELPELTVGEIAVSGRSVARGYINPRHSASSTRFCHGTLHTGDSGFLFQQQLFVLGRLGDSTKVLGQVVFAEDVEIALGEAGIPGNKVAALLGEREGIPTAVMVVEKCREEWHSALRAVATRHLGIKTILVNAPKGTIARTSSGKPKRRLLWRSFIAGTLPGDSVSLPVADSENSGVGPAQTWG